MKTLLKDSVEAITMYSTSWCSDCVIARLFFADHGITYEETDIDHNTQASELVVQINSGRRTIPTILIKEKGKSEPTILVEPSYRELEQALLDVSE